MRRHIIGILGLAFALSVAAGCKKEKFGIKRVEPSHGPYTGEQEVRIIGSGFDTKAGVTVSFGGTAARMAEIRDSSTIAVQLPVGTVGKTDVTVAFADGRTLTLPMAFEYTDPLEAGGGWTHYGEKDAPKKDAPKKDDKAPAPAPTPAPAPK